MLCLVPACSAERSQEQYFAVLLDGKKIGHAYSLREPAEGKVTTVSSMSLTISRAGMSLTVQQKETTVETAKGKPLSFLAVQDMAIMATQIEGVVKDGKIVASVTTGGQKQTKEMAWPEGAVMNEGQRLLELKQGDKEGTKYSAKLFSPSLMTAVTAEVTVGALKEVDLLGRVVPLREVTVVTKSPDSTMTSYVDKDHLAQKMATPMLGMNLELVACAKQVALSKEDVVDFFTRLLLPSPTPLKDLGSVGAIRYTLSPTGKEKFSLPTTGSQTVSPGEDGALIVTVRRPAPAKGVKFPYAGTDKALLAATRPALYLQSDHPGVVEVARQAVGDTHDAAEAVARIEKFVRGYIKKKDLSVGYASAAEVVAGRQGDCTEHAVLAAAMCRAVGIPAQVVSGLAYTDQFAGKKAVFGPHAWFQAYIGDQWVGCDAALNGYDAGHITLAFGDGGPEDFFGIAANLGYFKIAAVEIPK